MKYALYCLQQKLFYGAFENIEDTIHFESLHNLKQFIIDDMSDVLEPKYSEQLKFAPARYVAKEFDYKIESIF